MSTPPRARRPHRSWPQRLLIGFNIVCIVGALVAAGSLAYAKRKVGEIDRVQLGVDGFEGSAGLADDAPRNFLIVGADSDDGLDPNDPASAGRGSVVGVRSDTIMIARLDPKTGEAKVLSLPRDLYVEIPGNGRNRINASLQFGGPELLISTIKSNFDIDVNHYVEIDFAGFKRMVDLLGGMPIYFATPVRDTQSGLNVETAGCHTLTPDSALDYVRSRHLRYYDEDRGRWVADPTSDLGRISRQQDFIKRVLRRAISQGARNPVKLKGFVDVGVSNITLDDATTPGDLAALGMAFKGFDPEALQTYSLPVSDAYRGGAAVLELQTGEAESTLAMFRGTGRTTTVDGAIAPSSVAVRVLNGSGTQNQAGEASSVLASVGFKMQTPSSTAGVERTEVRYPAGQEAQAALVARHLYADPILVLDPDVPEVTVVTGPDFGAAIVATRPESDFPVPTTSTTTSTTSTTAPVTDTTVAEGTETTGTSAPAATTTTTEVTGFVPTAPAGVDCG